MDPPAYPASTHTIRCPTCKTLTNRAQLRKPAENAILDAYKAMTNKEDVTPQAVRNLDADIAAMFQDGQPCLLYTSPSPRD